MELELHHSGCMKLIRYLTLHIGDPEEKRMALLDELFMDKGFSEWVQAYSMYPGVKEALYQTLLDLDGQPSFPENETFLRKVRDGFLQAARDGFEMMRKRLQATTSTDSKNLEEKVNRYLPEGTPLSVAVVFTIDGFNTGMMRENTIFFSVLRVDPETYNPLSLAHEVHHVGVYYWFMKNAKWRKWYSMKGAPERATAELLAYIVAEGSANHLMSPTAVALREGDDERTLLHNERIRDLEQSYVSYLRQMEDIVLNAVNGEMEKSRKLFRELSIDTTGVGVPAGHYVSARMFSKILGEHDESIVTSIIEDPWCFFKLYDGLESKSHSLSERFLSFIVKNSSA